MLVADALQHYKVDTTTGCWLWQGHIRADGYGQATIKQWTEGAHRLFYEQLVGPIPDGLVLDHVYERGCRWKHCVNPAHLEPVTPSQNMLRWVAVQRAAHVDELL